MTNYSEKRGSFRGFAGAAILTAGVLSIVNWYRRPIPSVPDGEGLEVDYSLLDLYLPEAEFVGEVSVDIHAPASIIFNAIRRVTLDDMPLAKWIGMLRYLPGLLFGKQTRVEPAETKPFLEVLQTEGGNIVLDEETNSEIVVGAIGKFHNLMDQQIVPLRHAGDFTRFEEPDYQKLAMSIRLFPLRQESGYRLTLTHRTHALSRAARWKFALYWIGIKPGGNFVSWLMLRAIKSLAEKAPVIDALIENHSISNRRFL